MTRFASRYTLVVASSLVVATACGSGRANAPPPEESIRPIQPAKSPPAYTPKSDTQITEEYVAVFESLAQLATTNAGNCDALAAALNRELDANASVLDSMNTVTTESEMWAVYGQEFEPRYKPALRTVKNAIDACVDQGSAGINGVPFTMWCRPLTCFPGIGL